MAEMFKLEGELELQIKTMSDKMRIYKDEYSIAHLLHENKTIAYDTYIESSSEFDITPSFSSDSKNLSHLLFKDNNEDQKIHNIVMASINDKELFYHKSILVSTTWNKNDDVFTPQEVWRARHTPSHKPTNLEHNSSKIIGHMTSSWAIDTEGNLIDDTLTAEQLPSKFHILVGSVIYKYWPDNEEYSVQVASLLDSIDKGEKFVSMECRFDDFDYALSSDNDLKIIARNEDTAFLSKHIRAYGGTGLFKNYKVGRAVKNISFIGKGYVDKPANPESVIFTKENVFDFAQAKFCEKITFSEKVGVVSTSNDKEQKIMSDFYQEQNKKLESDKQALATQLDELKSKFAESHTKELEAKISTLETKASDIEKALKAEQEVVSTKTAEAETFQKQIADLTAANEELTKSNKEFVDRLAKIEADQKVQARVSTLVKGGFSEEDATKKVATFAALTDEQFTVIAETLIKAAKYGKDKEDKEDKIDVKAEDVEAAEITSPEVTSATITEPEKNDTVATLAKNLAESLKIQFGDK